MWHRILGLLLEDHGGAVGSPSTRLSLGASYVGLALWTGTQSLFACLDRYQFLL